MPKYLLLSLLLLSGCSGFQVTGYDIYARDSNTEEVVHLKCIQAQPTVFHCFKVSRP